MKFISFVGVLLITTACSLVAQEASRESLPVESEIVSEESIVVSEGPTVAEMEPEVVEDYEAAPVSLEEGLQNEDNLIAIAQMEALLDNDNSVDAELTSEPHEPLAAPESVLVSRRAAAVCVWLLNQQEIGRATRLANRVLQSLAAMPVETSSWDRFERLYWEAWLRAEVLGDRAAAMRLIQEAEPLKPDDARIAWSKQIWGTNS